MMDHLNHSALSPGSTHIQFNSWLLPLDCPRLSIACMYPQRAVKFCTQITRKVHEPSKFIFTRIRAVHVNIHHSQEAQGSLTEETSLVYVDLTITREKLWESLILGYKNRVKRFFILHNLILRTRSCVTGCIIQSGWVFHFELTESVRSK